MTREETLDATLTTPSLQQLVGNNTYLPRLTRDETHYVSTTTSYPRELPHVFARLQPILHAISSLCTMHILRPIHYSIHSPELK